jgi:hypothetical protein
MKSRRPHGRLATALVVLDDGGAMAAITTASASSIGAMTIR